MKKGVICLAVANNEIARCVVFAIAVYVMNNGLLREQFSKGTLRNNAMFKHVAVTIALGVGRQGDNHIALPVDHPAYEPRATPAPSRMSPDKAHRRSGDVAPLSVGHGSDWCWG